MTVKVKVFGYLNRYCGDFGRHEETVALPDHSTARELLAHLGIPHEEDLLLFVNQAMHTDRLIPLSQDDTVWIYPLLCEG